MKPIGFWFAHLHQALESSLDRILSAEALTRRHWQVLNTIDGGDLLTPAGQEAHARLKTEVGKFRARVTEGIGDDDYRTTVGVLERMAANLARE